ncbi:Lnk2 [Thalictrum thalictroides]|uniref:Lnk2 n=1 Tax=Thalictrum thalictroides TaxID=46969 RepID=A0A7J6VYH4_THATH|nr:Lnk2 [Thalictrum thalictroides]
MFDWNEELGDIIWGEASEVDDHIVPYPSGNEDKPLFIYGNHRKKQFIQEAKPFKVADQKISGAKDYFSGLTVESDTKCNTKEALDASRAEIDSWPDSPLTNVPCEEKFAERNTQSSISMQVSEFGTEIPNFDSARDTGQLEDGSRLFGNESQDKEHNHFLEYSWDNIGNFDDLDNMFRNDDPVFGRDGLGNAELLWSSSSDLFSSPTKSFPTRSPNSGVNVLSIAEQDMNPKHEELSQTPGFGKSDDLAPQDLKDLDSTADKASENDYTHLVNPIVDCVGEESKTLLEEKKDMKYSEKIESWKTQSTSKVNGKRNPLNCPTKEETEEESSQVLRDVWSLPANQLQAFGNQFATSVAHTIPSSVSSQKQVVGPKPLFFWQPSHPYLSAADGIPQHWYPVMPTIANDYSQEYKYQPMLVEYRGSPGPLKHANPVKVFPAPSKPPTMTPREKLEKLKRRQQRQAMIAIQEQQQQFGHQALRSGLYNVGKCPQENQYQDTEVSTTEVEENLLHPSMAMNSLMEHDDSNTVPMEIDNCSLEERVLDQLQDVIEKLDMRVRLSIRDSLFRLAQSSMQRNNTTDTSSTNINMQCDGATAKDEAHGHNRLPRIPEVEKETNPIDRTVAHLLFHQSLELSTRPAKDNEALGSPPGFVKFTSEPRPEGIMNFSAGCLSDGSMDKRSFSQPACLGSDTIDVDQSESKSCKDTPENMAHDKPGEIMAP